MKNKCTSVQMSDSVVCDQCQLEWDVNDDCRPSCKPLLASGMTLRDHFAGMAMQALASSNMSNESSVKDIAKWAYLEADAMMKERLH